NTERRVLKLLVGALPRTGKTVHVYDMRICARRLMDEPFEITLKEDVFDVRLFAPHVIGKRNNIIPQPWLGKSESEGIDSTRARRVPSLRILAATLPTA